MLRPMLTSGLEFGVLRLLAVRLQKLKEAAFHYQAYVFYSEFHKEKKRISRYPKFFLAQYKTKCWNLVCMCMCVCMLLKFTSWNSCFPAIAVTELIYGAGLILTFVRLIFPIERPI